MVTHARKVPGPGFVQTASLAAGASAPVRVLVISRNRNKHPEMMIVASKGRRTCMLLLRIKI